MDLFKLKTLDEPVGIYARVPDHIIDLVTHYYNQSRDEGMLDDPRLAKWASKIPEPDDIAKVESGFMRYHARIINLNPREVDMEGDLFSERMQVTNDFEVAVSPEGLPYFDMQRRQLPDSKRRELFKFQTPGVFGGLYFVPEDVMIGIVKYDLSSHIERSKKVRERIEQVKANHPNLA